MTASLGVAQETNQLRSLSDSPRRLAELKLVRNGLTLDLVATTKTIGNCTLFVKTMDGENFSPSESIPWKGTLSGMSTTVVMSIKAKDPVLGYNVTFSYDSAYGAWDAQPDASVIYELPYEEGHSKRVIQGYLGKDSHVEGASYSLDFGMRVGVKEDEAHQSWGVHAARAGTVVGIRLSASNRAKKVKQYDGNYIVIQHSDRTIGLYSHLTRGGVVVPVGATVKAGQLIGRSGASGFCHTWHLHFAVHRVARRDERGVSVPVRFRTADGILTELSAGKSYTAVAPPAN